MEARHKLIVEQRAHSKVSDVGLLAETALMALAYNIRRVITLLAIPAMIAALV